MRYLFGFFLLGLCFSSEAQNMGDDSAIRALLARQVNEWNRGHVAGYMVGYWESDSLVFIGKSGPTYGYQQTLNRYRKSYPDAAHMGNSDPPSSACAYSQTIGPMSPGAGS